MLFSSPTFLFLFLPAVLALFFLLPSRARSPFLALVSLFFYAWGEKRGVVLLAGSVVANWGLALLLDRQESERRRRLVVGVAAAVDMGALVYFKYADFLVANVDAACERLGLGTFPLPEVALPIGVSFVTFEALSYVVDVYRREIRPSRDPFHVAFYISFFPHLIAGPIVRYGAIAGQLERPAPDLDGFASGVRRFSLGLAKKLVLANTLATLADAAFDAAPSALSAKSAWLGVVAYSLQIYYDFSGYSDMAVGLGRMFGFSLPENFAAPYSARSVRDFWRRWHISLSTWFRDYVYIPLGGSRGSRALTYRNLFTIFLLCGLWHGASWNFVLWGAYHGLFLVVERLPGLRRLERAPVVLQRAYALVTVALGWVLFRAGSLEACLGYLRALAGAFHPALEASALLPLTPEVAGALLVGGTLAVGPVETWRRALNRPALVPVVTAGTCSLLALALLYMAGSTYDPFIYFRF